MMLPVLFAYPKGRAKQVAKVRTIVRLLRSVVRTFAVCDFSGSPSKWGDEKNLLSESFILFSDVEPFDAYHSAILCLL